MRRRGTPWKRDRFSISEGRGTRFFFHVGSDDGFEEDVDGTEFPTLEDAVSEARRAGREMVAELILHEGRLDLRAFEIADRKHIVLSIVRFCDLIGID